MAGPPWTEREINLLRARYGRDGPAALAKSIKRSQAAVQKQAVRLGLRHAHIAAHVRAGDVAAAAGVRTENVTRAAKAERVARVLTTGQRNTILVPPDWAERYIQQAIARQEAHDLAGHHYTADKLARLFGVHRRTLWNWLAGNGAGATIIARIRRTKASGTLNSRWLFNPYDAEEALKAWKSRFEE
jgi:hypothetical protein